MEKQAEQIDRYLRGLSLPECHNELFRRGLRHQVLAEVERRWTMSTHHRIRKLVFIALALIGGGAMATAVGMKVYRHHFEGQAKTGEYIFSIESETVYKSPTDAKTQTVVTRSGTVSMGYEAQEGAPELSEAEKIEQMQQDLEEIEWLRQNDQRELTAVTERWVNGRFHRSLHFRYVLTDERTRNMAEGDPDLQKPQTSAVIERENAEIDRLRTQGKGVLTRIVEERVGDDTYRVCMVEYTLRNGRTRTVGESDSDPAVGRPLLSPKQRNEVWRLRSLKEGEFLGDLDREIRGMVFSCETYRFILDDGTVVTHAVGDRKDRKTHLTNADYEEFHGLMAAGAGEILGTEDREIRGILFRFERQRYVLSDGTEIIRAFGKPQN